MANWKIGDGEDYDSIVGYEFSPDEHPSNEQRTFVVKQKQEDYDLKESNIVLDKGIQSSEITFDGRLRNDTDFYNLQQAVMRGRIIITAGDEETDLYYEKKFYPGDDYFYYVKRGQCQRLREGNRPLLRNYTVRLQLTDPFRYKNTTTDRTASGSGGTTSAMDFTGNYYQLPELEFETTSGTVTRIDIESNAGGSISASIPGGLATGERVVIDQRLEILFIYDSSGNLKSSRSGFSGRIAIPQGSEGVTFTFEATGGSGTFTARHRERNW